jgi:hypothetical protein
MDDAGSFEQRVQQIQGNWRAQLGRVRSGWATDLLPRSLPGAPVLTVSGAAELIDRSFPQTNQAVARLTQAGVLSQVTVGKRNCAFEAKDIINALANLEGQFASPRGDTRRTTARSQAGRYHPDAPYFAHPCRVGLDSGMSLVLVSVAAMDAESPSARHLIRTALHDLRARNGQHTFEDLCRDYARRTITPYILPATGPVGAGGDQGRDFETFRSYVAETELDAFPRVRADCVIAFACTIQASDLKRKIQSDIRKIVSGEPVDGIRVFTEADVLLRCGMSCRPGRQRSTSYGWRSTMGTGLPRTLLIVACIRSPSVILGFPAGVSCTRRICGTRHARGRPVEARQSAARSRARVAYRAARGD